MEMPELRCYSRISKKEIDSIEVYKKFIFPMHVETLHENLFFLFFFYWCQMG